MTAPAKLSLNSEQLWLAKELAKGNMDWDELSYERKMMLYNTGYDLTDTISNKQLSELEVEMKLRGEEGFMGVLEGAATAALQKVR